jgi:hypothetical protein
MLFCLALAGIAQEAAHGFIKPLVIVMSSSFLAAFLVAFSSAQSAFYEALFAVIQILGSLSVIVPKISILHQKYIAKSNAFLVGMVMISKVTVCSPFVIHIILSLPCKYPPVHLHL